MDAIFVQPYSGGATYGSLLAQVHMLRGAAAQLKAQAPQASGIDGKLEEIELALKQCVCTPIVDTPTLAGAPVLSTQLSPQLGTPTLASALPALAGTLSVLAEPSYSVPTFGAPSFSTPAFSAPTLGAPSFSAPVYSVPTLGAPTFSTPAFNAPTLRTSTLGSPALGAPSTGVHPPKEHSRPRLADPYDSDGSDAPLRPARGPPTPPPADPANPTPPLAREARELFARGAAKRPTKQAAKPRAPRKLLPKTNAPSAPSDVPIASPGTQARKRRKLAQLSGQPPAPLPASRPPAQPTSRPPAQPTSRPPAQPTDWPPKPLASRGPGPQAQAVGPPVSRFQDASPLRALAVPQHQVAQAEPCQAAHVDAATLEDLFKWANENVKWLALDLQ